MLTSVFLVLVTKAAVGAVCFGVVFTIVQLLFLAANASHRRCHTAAMASESWGSIVSPND